MNPSNSIKSYQDHTTKSTASRMEVCAPPIIP
jgi:hypothetical protein